uniref:Uncharacterized protein n=1 Tax=Amphora coffeiformis TaxID=265554 RepID=A0A7S3L7I4_9STRA
MATKFADISKGPNDLLTDDFSTKFVLKTKKSAGPVAFTIETEQDKSGALSSKIGTKYSFNKFSLDKGQLKGDGSRILETSFKVSDDVKLSFKGGKGADLCVDYTKGGLYATGVFDVMEMSKMSTSACMSLAGGLKVGADATYSLSGSAGGLKGFNVGASYSTGPLFASVTATSNSKVNLGLLYKVNSDLSLASSTTHASDKLCTVHGVGLSYKIADVGTLKAKYNSEHVLSACLTRELVPKVTLTASGSVPVSDLSAFKPGFTLNI